MHPHLIITLVDPGCGNCDNDDQFICERAMKVREALKTAEKNTYSLRDQLSLTKQQDLILN